MFGTAIGAREVACIALALLGIALLAYGFVRRKSMKPARLKLLKTFASLVLFSTLSLYAYPLFALLQGFGISLPEGIVKYVLDCIWWLIFAILSIRALDTFLWKGILTQDDRLLVPKVLVIMSNVAVLGIVGMMLAYFVFGQSIKDISSLLTSAGIVFAAISYFAKVPIDSAFTGLQINIANIFRNGNRVQISDPKATIEGTVSDIGWSHITLKMDSGSNIYIPNSEILKRTVVNLERPTPDCRYDLEVALDFKVPVSRGRTIIEAALNDLEDNLTRFEVGLKNFSATGVTYLIQFWLAKKMPHAKALDLIHSALYYKIQKELSIDLGFDKNNSIHTGFSKGLNIDPEKRVELLRKVSIFSSLADAEMLELAQSSIPRSYGPPEKIVRQGDAGDSMFVVADGQVQIYLKPANGERIQVAIDGPGQYFGEMALLTGQPRGATATPLNDVTLLEIPKEGLRKILEADPGLAGKIAESVAAIQAMNEELVAQAGAKASNLAARKKSLSDNIKKGVMKFFGLDEATDDL